MGELGGVLQGVVHRLGDDLADVGHLLDSELLSFACDVAVHGLPYLEVRALDHACETAALCGGLVASVGRHGLGESCPGASCRRDDVTLYDASVRAGACDLCRVHAFLRRCPAGSGRDGRSCGHCRCGDFGLGCRRGRLSLCRLCRGCCGCGLGRRSARSEFRE